MWSILIKLYAQKRQSVLYGCCLDVDYVRVDQPLMSRDCHSTNTPNSIAIFTANSNNSDNLYSKVAILIQLHYVEVI